MEIDIPLGWKPLNLERYDRTTNPDEHLNAFLTQANLYTNDDEQSQISQIKHDKRAGSTKIGSHKSDKRHKSDRRQFLPKMSRYERYRLLTANHTTILEEAFNLEPSLLKDRTTTKQEQDLEDTERSSRGITMQTEEEIERNIEVDKDSNNDTSNNLHKNRNLPNKSEV
ncbi:hypothetical protein JHK82_048191 [Glycine max]|nr:hypothetical protein JHK82_048191 [Glycine max]